jgi:50S ribosomal protein L16 3-hydroxylase
MRSLANERRLMAAQVRRASAVAQAMLAQWFELGWLHRVGDAGSSSQLLHLLTRENP